MKKIKIKNILIIMLILVEVIATYFMYKSSTNKEVVLDNVELKELIDNNSFAIYLDGNEYTSSTTWPESAAFQKAECQNEKGDILNGILTFNEKENKAYINNTTQTTYCYLYFKSCNGPVGTVLAGKDEVSKCEVGGMYRYQGTNDVNNYICFGTTDQTTCTSNADKYMYRIIGVTPEGELALIKETVIKEGNKTQFQWNDKYTTKDCEEDGSGCTWENSKLFNRLNGLCETGNANCMGTGAGEKGQTNLFINSEYYDYLTSDSVWESMIDYHTWKYGDTNKNNGSYDGDSAYAIENAFPNNVEAKIGLQYIHDYYYAYPNGNSSNSSEAKNAWIHFRKDSYNTRISYEWLISYYGVTGTYVNAWFVSSVGNVSNRDLHDYSGVRPVFYLNKDVTFKSGTTGEKSNPYIIDGIKEETYTANFHFGSKKNDTVTTRSVSWIATWTLPNATDVCFTTSSTSDDCNWTSLSNVVTSSYGGIMSFYAGTYTYYFYVKNAAGQIASDSDTLTVKEIAPTCSFNVTTSGVTLVPSNATSWYMSTYQTSRPSYGTETSSSALGENTYYGYVQNAFETTGTCQLEMYKATQNACYQTGSSDGGYTNCTGTYMLGAYTPTESSAGDKCFLSHESSNIYNNCSAPCDVIRSGLGTIPSSVPTCPNGYYTLDSCTCSCQSVTTYTCSNGQTCGESGCCSSMFCGSDNCRSGYTAIEYDNYTRYCYK